MKIIDVWPVVHLHITHKTDSKRVVTIAELCKPNILEILGETANGERSARLRFDCYSSQATDILTIAIRGTLNQEGKFSPTPVYLEKILREETTLISKPSAYFIGVEILRRAPGNTAIISYGHREVIWSAEHSKESDKLVDIIAAVTDILDSDLEGT